MDIPLVTVSRWANQGKIPCKLKGGNFLFKKNEIVSWARSHHLRMKEDSKTQDPKANKDEIGLFHAVSRGMIYHRLEGNDVYSVLKNAVEKMEFEGDADKKLILDELIGREEIASTGIGNGVAIPHPRRPLPLGLNSPVIWVFFLAESVDFNAVDGKPIFVLFFMFSPSTQVHLNLLARLSFCLREKTFMSMLKKRSQPDVFLSAISRIESGFGNG
jgi:PTS system nitrogen regulatory IIA component